MSEPHARTESCDTCGQPHPRCYAHKDGRPCRAWPIKGARVCKNHGGMAAQVRAKANGRLEEAKASRELARLGQKVTVHPAEALLDLVHWTAGEVAYWRQVVTEVAEHNDGKDLLWGTTKTKEGGDDRGTTKEAKPHIAYTLLERASDRLAQYATAALKAGVDERRVQLAERQGDLVASVIRNILDRLNLTDEQTLLVGTVVPEELRLLVTAKEPA